MGLGRDGSDAPRIARPMRRWRFIAVWGVCFGCSAPVDTAAEPPAAPPVPPGLAPAAPVPSQLVAPALTIVETPITWNDEREALTLAYRREHTQDGVDTVVIEPRVVVLHWTGSGSFAGAFATFDPPKLEGRAELADASALNVSAHFLVDRDGTIHRLMPEDRMARHVIGLNHVAIGVENVGDGGANPLTDAQIEANVAIVRDLASRHAITHVIGHHEYREMEGHPYFREADPTYRTGKSDPGDAFMAAVRAGVADLGLSGPP